MENTSGTTSVKDAGLLTVKSSPHSGQDAATQTPQMIRQHTPMRNPIRPASRGSCSSDESMDYEDTFSHPPSRNADMILSMPIPEIIVEHSKDTFILTEEEFHSLDSQPAGVTNMAFEGSDEMVRSSSSSSLRQNASGYRPVDPVFVRKNHHLLIPSNSLDPRNRRLYYSLPRAHNKKNQEKDLQIRSQPPTPQMSRAKQDTASGMDDDTTFWIIPREHSLNSLNTIPTPASNYAAADSVNGLYAISGRSTFMSNGFSEPVISLYEMHLMPPVGTPAPSATGSSKRFEFTKMPAAVDRRRRRLQLYTDILSSLLFFPGLLIAGITPALVVPLFYVTPPEFIPYILIFLSTGTLSAAFLACAGLAGNIVWIYDENAKKLRARLHCGKGPTFHFWGNGFFGAKLDDKQKELIV